MRNERSWGWGLRGERESRVEEISCKKRGGETIFLGGALWLRCHHESLIFSDILLFSPLFPLCCFCSAQLLLTNQFGHSPPFVMSCESCAGCFEATPCSAPSSLVNGHISKEYRQFLKAARTCALVLSDQAKDTDKGKEEHVFNGLISTLASHQFTAQTYLALAYKQLGPRDFLQLAQSLAHHGFWGRLITWAFVFAEEDSRKLQGLVDQQDAQLFQHVNDEAEMFEVFNPAVSCQRIAWSPHPVPTLAAAGR